MNRRLNSLIPFGLKRRHRTAKYLNGGALNRILPMLVGAGVGAGLNRRYLTAKSLNGSPLSRIWPALVGAGVGAGLMYVLDPDHGGRRRAIARDKVATTISKTGQAIGSKSRDLKNRARGAISENIPAMKSNEAEKKPQLRQ